MNQHGITITIISPLSIAFLLVFTIGCASLQSKSNDVPAETTTVSAGEEEMGENVTQERLRAMLMDFADTFATSYASAVTILLEQAPSSVRAYAAGSRFFMADSVFDIASSRYPGVGLVDMVVLVTLSRMNWEDYWQPQVFGDSARMVVKTLRKRDDEIWSVAAKVLTPTQINELRALIYKWRETNQGRQAVTHIRFSNLRNLTGQDSELERETQPGGLFAPLTQATRAADEIRLFAERAMYRLSRMQATLGLQMDSFYHNFATQQEVRQLLSDITGLRETVERLPLHISAERKNLMRDLESQEKTIQNMLAAIRQTISEGNDLISLANETTKTVDTISGRIDAILLRPPKTRPFDIMDYHNTVLVASDAIKQAKSLLDSLEGLLASSDWQQHVAVVLKLADGVESEGEELINHAFFLGLVLMMIFFLGIFLLIRYASKQLIGLRKERGIT